MTGVAAEDFAPACPIPKGSTLKNGLKHGRYAITPLGLERLCARCGEHWPADTEFFFSAPSSPAGLHCWCKACYVEWRKTKPQQAA